MKRSHLLLFLLLLMTAPAFAQDYGSGQDSVECIKQLNLYRDFRDSKEFRKALPHWQKAVELCPRASKRLYIDGEDFYETFIEKAKDTAMKRTYVDSLMWVYDKRTKEYGQEAFVKGKKGSHLVKYRKFLPPKRLMEANRMLKSSIHTLGKESSPTSIARYFFSLYFLYKADQVKRNEILLEYLPIASYVDSNITDPKSKKHKKYFMKVEAKIDKIFKVLAKCDTLQKLYSEELGSDTGLSPEMKRQMMMGMKERGCQEQELYPRLAKSVHKEEPTASSAYEIGVLEMKNGKNKEAAKYLSQAIELMKEDSAAVDSSKLVEYYIAAGRNANERGLASKANELARKALGIDGDNGRAYVIVAEAIANSAGACSENKLQKGAVYWLAADYLKKARQDTSVEDVVKERLGNYRANFPDKSTMFEYGQLNDNGEPVDQPFEIGCWIGETTMPRKSW